MRAEIREIEEKLQRKKQKKGSTVKMGEIEDGECIDSDEDEQPAEAAKAPEEVKDKHREDQRKRWCDDRRNPDRRDKSHSRGSREERDRDSYYRYDRRERERHATHQPYYEYDHRQPRY